MSKPSLDVLLLFFVGLLVATHASGQGWERLHTFTNATYGLLACSPTQRVCLSSSFAVATSDDLTNWTEHGTASLPAGLFETTEYSVFVEPLHLAALSQGGYLMVVLKTELPQLGNARFESLLSLKSQDGLAWTDETTITAYCPGVDSSFLTQAGQQILFAYGDPPGGWIQGACFLSQCCFFSYHFASNAWQLVSTINAARFSYQLFADGEAFYFMRRECPSLAFPPEPDLAFLQRTTNGRVWTSLPSTPDYVWSAGAHRGQIIGDGACYSPGAGWQSATNTQLRHILYNGDTVVGVLGRDLVVSRDFGSSWQRQPLAETDRITIVEDDGRYVALATERSRDDDPLTPDVIQTSVFVAQSHTARALQTNALALTFEGQSLTFAAQSNVVYQVETSRSLTALDWVTYGLPLVSTSSAVKISIPRPASVGSGFLRVGAVSAQPGTKQSK